MAKATHMPRRGFLKAIPATAAALAMPSAALASEESPIKKLMTRWRSVVAEYNANGGDDVADQPLADEMARLEAEILATPPQTVSDYACKVIVVNEFSVIEGVPYGDVFMEEARALVG